jgi:hypothetical protein
MKQTGKALFPRAAAELLTPPTPEMYNVLKETYAEFLEFVINEKGRGDWQKATDEAMYSLVFSQTVDAIEKGIGKEPGYFLEISEDQAFSNELHYATVCIAARRGFEPSPDIRKQVEADIVNVAKEVGDEHRAVSTNVSRQ